MHTLLGAAQLVSWEFCYELMWFDV